eukprot:1949258-Amphidinium_carterae.2
MPLTCLASYVGSDVRGACCKPQHQLHEFLKQTGTACHPNKITNMEVDHLRCVALTHLPAQNNMQSKRTLEFVTKCRHGACIKRAWVVPIKQQRAEPKSKKQPKEAPCCHVQEKSYEFIALAS